MKDLFKKGIKKFLQSPLTQTLLGALGAFYLWIVFKTNHWTVQGREFPEHYWKEKKPFLVAFWHGRLLMMPFAWQRGIPFSMLISSHKDGKIISKIVGYYGIKTIHGSSSKGGSMALRSLLRELKEGTTIGVTPDGPRGPNQQVSGSIISMAKAAGVPIVPLTYATSRRKILGTWDRFHLALPFGKGVFCWGNPLIFSHQQENQDWDKILEDQMNKLQEKAERFVSLHKSRRQGE